MSEKSNWTPIGDAANSVLKNLVQTLSSQDQTSSGHRGSECEETQEEAWGRYQRDLKRIEEFQRLAIVHWSDCAVHNAPYLPNGPCNCGAKVTEPKSQVEFEPK